METLRDSLLSLTDTPSITSHQVTASMIINGVLVHPKGSGLSGAEKYNHHPVIVTALTSCPYIWRVPLRLDLSLCIIYKEYPPPIHNPRDGYELFFYTDKNPMVAFPLIVFRSDFKPLHPKQVQALWKFLRHLMRKFCYTNHPTQYPNRWGGMPADLVGGDYNERFWGVDEYWYNYCTMNNFSAFFYWLRNQKLIEGDESWRFVSSPYDL